MSLPIQAPHGPEMEPALQSGDVSQEFFEGIDNLKKYSEIVDIRLLGPTEIIKKNGKTIGSLERWGFVTRAGYGYDAIAAIPSEPKSHVPLLGTSAWITSGSHGHNEHTSRHWMRELRVPVLFVGQEGGYRYRASEIPYDVDSRPDITLAGSAAATLRFSQIMPELYGDLIDSTKRTLVGESRGGMVGMGILALDKLFDQEIVYADLTAPCFPKKPAVMDLLRLTGHLLGAPQSVGNIIPHFALKQVIHLPPTLDLNPSAISHELAIGRALFSGEAGELARLIKNDVIAHITVFDKDYASMRHIWKDIFSSHSGVRITPLPGTHLSLADPQTLSFVEARHNAYNMLSEQGPVDGQEMFDLAHQLVLAA